MTKLTTYFPISPIEPNPERPKPKRADVIKIHPMTRFQTGLLVASINGNHSGTYNETYAWTLDGDLNVPDLKRSWDTVIAKHDCLHSVFSWSVAAKPSQIVIRPELVTSQYFNEHDWRQSDPEDHDAMLAQFCDAHNGQNFDLVRPPLMAIDLIQLADKKHAFFWTIHHLTIDGLSGSKVLQQVFSVYNSRVKSLPTPQLHAVPFSEYVDFRNSLPKEHAKSYWHAKMAGFETPTRIPGKRLLDIANSASDITLSAKPQPGPVGHDFQLKIDDALLVRLQETAAKFRVTLNTLCQTAVTIAISKLSGQSDIVLPTVTAHRPPDFKGAFDVVGPLLRAVPLRIKTTPADTALTLSKMIADAAAEAESADALEIDEIAAVSDVSDPAAGLSDLLYAFENFQEPTMLTEAETIKVSPLYSQHQTHNALSVIFTKSDNLSVRLLYDPDHIPAVAVSMFAEFLHKSLNAVCDGQDRKLSNLDIGLDSLMAPPPLVELPDLHQVWRDQLEKDPETPFYSAGTYSLNRQEVDHWAGAFHDVLENQNVDPAGCIALALSPGPHLYAAVLSILLSGRSWVTIPQEFPLERQKKMASLSGSCAVLVDDTSAKNWHDGDLFVINAAALANSSEMKISAIAPCRNAQQSIACKLFTSGSTGDPKCIEITRRNLQGLLTDIRVDFDLATNGVIGQLSSWSFDAALFEWILSFNHASALVHIPKEIYSDRNRFAAFTQSERISTFFSTPTVLATMSPHDLDTVSTVVVGGEPFPQDLKEKWRGNTKVFEAYGPAETSIYATSYLLGDDLKKDGVGKKRSDAVLQINDIHGCQAGSGIVGEVVIAGGGVAAGYRNLRKEQKNGFNTKTGAYHTGDLGWLDCQNNLHLLGRIDSQIKINGVRIETDEIRSALCAHPDILDAAVAYRKPLLAAAVTCKPTKKSTLTNDTLFAFLRGKLPLAMIPGVILTLETLPIGPTGKTDTKAILALAQQESDNNAAPIVSDDELRLAGLWTETFDAEPQSVTQSMFSLGATSLDALKLAAGISKKFDVTISAADLQSAPTLRQQLELINAQGISAREEYGHSSAKAIQIRDAWLSNLIASPELIPALQSMIGLRLHGQIDFSRLKQAYETVYSHVSKTLGPFRQTDSGDWISVQADLAQLLVIKDVREVQKQQGETAIQQMVEDHLAKPIDPQNDFALQAIIWKTGEDSALITLKNLEPVIDGVSRSAFAKAVVEQYLSGQRAPISIQRFDANLKDENAAVENKPDVYSETPMIAHRGIIRYENRLPEPISVQLQHTAAQLDVGVSAIYYASFALLARKEAASCDGCFVTPLSMRNSAAAPIPFGPLTNSLPFHIPLNDNDTAESWIKRSASKLQELSKNCAMSPFDLLAHAKSAPQKNNYWFSDVGFTFVQSDAITVPDAATVLELELEATRRAASLYRCYVAAIRSAEGQVDIAVYQNGHAQEEIFKRYIDIAKSLSELDLNAALNAAALGGIQS